MVSSYIRSNWRKPISSFDATPPRTLSQSGLVEEIRKLSSKWIKGLDPKYRRSYWRRGYGAFSLGRSQLEAVVKSVSEQERHHRRASFQEEFRRGLAKYGVAFDERYVWDYWAAGG